MSARPKGWPAEADAELIRRFKAGELIKVIAGAMDRPTYAVAKRLEKMRAEGRVPRRNRSWTEADRRVLVAAYEGGASWADLTAVFGCRRRTLKNQIGIARRATAVVLPFRQAA